MGLKKLQDSWRNVVNLVHRCPQVEDAVMPYLTVFANFREDIRKVARDEKGWLCSNNSPTVVGHEDLPLSGFL